MKDITPRSASFLDHFQTDAVYFGDGNVSALQLNKNSPNWAESHGKAFEKRIFNKFPNGVLQLGRVVGPKGSLLSYQQKSECRRFCKL